MKAKIKDVPMESVKLYLTCNNKELPLVIRWIRENKVRNIKVIEERLVSHC